MDVKGERLGETQAPHYLKARRIDKTKIALTCGEHGCQSPAMVFVVDNMLMNEWQHIVAEHPKRGDAQPSLHQCEGFHQDIVGGEQQRVPVDQLTPGALCLLVIGIIVIEDSIER
jgi:hypothetical protein